MKLTKSTLIEALTESRGVISVAAKSLDCTRQTIYNHINKDEEIKQAREDAREGMIDCAENALFNLIDDPKHKDHFKALRYYLETQGQSRGYGKDRKDGAISDLAEQMANWVDSR